jgi:predicted metal-dependent phosphoesterase TrpH
MQLNYYPYDFHLHTHFSDGVLSPEALVDLAKEKGVLHLALTDHDTTAGTERARIHAEKQGIRFTPGVEISADWNGKVIHILGLDIDTTNVELANFLKQIQDIRYLRLQEMLAKLKKCRIEFPPDSFPAVEGLSYGRMHIAMALVKKEVVGKLASAFKQYLARGRRAYVATEWPSLESVVEVILKAGGIPVIAHPRRYKISFKRLTELADDFKAAGGRGIELATPNQSPDDQRLIYSLAQEKDFLLSQGSDFHYPEGYAKPGMTGGMPEGKYVWESFGTVY